MRYRPGMADPVAAFSAFWRYYEPRRDKLVSNAVTPTPLAAFYASMTPEHREMFGPQLIAAARRVGETKSFADLDRAQRAIGTAFAHAGITYEHVFAALFAFRDGVFDAIVADVGADSEVMRGLLLYIEHAVVHIGAAYVQTTMELVVAQRKQILELSVPILRIAPRVVLVPLLGELSNEKVTSLTARILAVLREDRAELLVLDLTGITRVEAQATTVLEGIVGAARLMGAKVMVCGLSSDVAGVIVDRQIELSGVSIVGDLTEAITKCVAEPATKAARRADAR